MANKKLKIDKKTVSKLTSEELKNTEGGRTTDIRITDLCNKSDLYCALN